MKSQNSRNQGFSYYFCVMIEGSGSGSIPLTNGSGSWRYKNIRIRRIRIRIRMRNTVLNVVQDEPGLDCRVPRVAAAQPAGRRCARPHHHRHRQGLDPQRPGGEGDRPRPRE
jgi:hypothetical protein